MLWPKEKFWAKVIKMPFFNFFSKLVPKHLRFKPEQRPSIHMRIVGHLDKWDFLVSPRLDPFEEFRLGKAFQAFCCRPRWPSCLWHNKKVGFIFGLKNPFKSELSWRPEHTGLLVGFVGWQFVIWILGKRDQSCFGEFCKHKGGLMV